MFVDRPNVVRRDINSRFAQTLELGFRVGLGNIERFWMVWVKKELNTHDLVRVKRIFKLVSPSVRPL